MIIGGLIIRFINPFVSNDIITILVAATCFAFGISLHFGKRSNGWIQKFVVAIFFIFFIFWDLGYVVLPQLKYFFDVIGINGFVIRLFYVFCGWSFFK
ncbi:MAG: hypothetical protein RR766_06930 [Longicatena sp.]